MKDLSPEYLAYIKSERWQQKRRWTLSLANGVCQECGMRDAPLEVHHLTYERLGNERPTDLVVVCRECHKKLDAERKEKAADARWDARVDGWATKVYGEGWEDYYDYWDVEEEFESWLEERDDDR